MAPIQLRRVRLRSGLGAMTIEIAASHVRDGFRSHRVSLVEQAADAVKAATR